MLTSSLGEILIGAIGEWVAGVVEAAGADGVTIGLSGGVDSAVCAGICARALGPRRVEVIAMPCDSDPADRRDAVEIAGSLSLDLLTVELDDALRAVLSALGYDRPDQSRLRVGNLKARLRMMVLYDRAHASGRLVAGTGNYSEYLVGYSTKWGDAACDLLPLGKLYKDEIVDLIGPLGLPAWLGEKPPTAGLWPGQTDEAELGVTYAQIRSYGESGLRGLDAVAEERIMKLVESSEHKRSTTPVFDAREWLALNA